jgi:hypothetical protein
MQVIRHGIVCRLGGVALCAAAVISCASTKESPDARNEALSTADSSRVTQQEVQSKLMAFADRYFAVTLDAAKTLERTLETPESRHTAAAARLVALIVTTDLAASPNPGAALLDMTVFVTLKRIVWEEYWMVEVYHEVGDQVLVAYLELEDDIWEIAASVYTPEQLAELRNLIDSWRKAHPETTAVDFMRLTELGDARQVQDLVEAGRPGGMLAPVKEANRNIEEMRLLAERLTFMATRMQLLISLQVEMASAKLAVQPEIQQLLEDSRRFADVSDRLTEAFATLVADLPEERRSAIDQILKGLGEEREQILLELTAEDGGVRPALGDLRDTFEAGRQLAETINEVVVNMDRLADRMLEEDPARPFDIMDYKTTIEEATKTVQEIQSVLASVDQLLTSAVTDEELNTILRGANRLEDEVIDDIIDRAFLQGVALIVIFFVVLACYRLLMRRLVPDLGSKHEADR